MAGRSWQELLHEDDAIPLVKEWHAECPHAAVLLDALPRHARRTLEALQVTTRSPLGAVAFHTGGILVDDGWLRILGSGHERLPRAIDEWNGLGGELRASGALLVADDAVGGFFAWFDEPRTIHYLAPDTYRWEDLELGYSDWLAWCFTDRVAEFYAELRWDGWQTEVAELAADRALFVYPPLAMRGPPIAERTRRAVDVDELWRLALDFERQLRDVADGEQVTLTVVDDT